MSDIQGLPPESLIDDAIIGTITHSGVNVVLEEINNTSIAQIIFLFVSATPCRPDIPLLGVDNASI